MLIKDTSPFRKPPLILLPEQVITLDAIRYSLEICDISYSRLKDNLYRFNFSNEKSKPSFPLLYSDVWTIIQHLTLFLKIVKTQFKITQDNPIYEPFEGLFEIRNAAQHIDETLTDILSKNNYSVYGNLSWYAQEKTDSKKGVITSLYSGSFSNKEEVKASATIPSRNFQDQLIEQIEFKGIVRPSHRNGLKKERILVIDKLMSSTEQLIEFFESQLISQFENHNVKEKHVSDLAVNLFVDIQYSNEK